MIDSQLVGMLAMAVTLLAVTLVLALFGARCPADHETKGLPQIYIISGERPDKFYRGR